MKQFSRSAVSAAFVVAVTVLGGVAPAHADEGDAHADAIVGIVQDAAAVALIDDDSVQVTDEGISAVADGVRVEVPADPERGIVLGSGAAAVTIGLPFADEAEAAAPTRVRGTTVYDNNNASVTVPVIRDDGAVQISTVIEDPSAPHAYPYRLSLPGDAPLTKGERGDVSATPAGSTVPLVYIAAPWAQDADGNAVATHFEISGDTVTQVVDFTEHTAFPVVADPATYVDSTTSSVIDVSRQGTVSRWQYLNGCTAAKGRSCSVSRTYTVTASTQTTLGVSKSVISASIGVTDGASIAVAATCGVPNGPGTATLYAQAEKTLYRVKTVRRWGVPTAAGGSMHTEVKVSGWLAAYNPNGRFSCV